MILHNQLQEAGIRVSQNLTAWLPQMIGYKTSIQKAILDVATYEELEDVRDANVNQSLIDKLCRFANKELQKKNSPETLYSLSIAVATIIKEYDWGTYYIIGKGLLELADRIQNV